MRVKERSEKPGLKLNIQKKLKSWSLVPSSWQIDEEKMKEVTDFISLGSKISVDGDYSQEIKRCLLLERKDMVNLVKVEVAQPVQLFSTVQLFATPWSTAHQASLSFTISRSLLKLMSIELVMPSHHLILCPPISSCLQSFPASESFPVSQFFASGCQRIGVSASASVLPMNIQDWFPLGWTGWISLQSKRLSRVFSNTTVQKHQFFGAQLSLWSNFHIHTWLLKKL